MAKRKIFLSYRRDDVPGYVARLEDELEKAFGTDEVFRDVEDIRGGSDWRKAIERNLREAAALVLVIGRHWEDIWRRRQDDPVNYVELELERARELGVAVIPVFIEGARLSRDLDLGKIGWLRDKQFYEISDKQQRWDHDVSGLIDILRQVDGLQQQQAHDIDPAPAPRSRSTAIGGAIIASLLLVAGWWYWPSAGSGSSPDQPVAAPAAGDREPPGGPTTVLADAGERAEPVAAVAAAKPRVAPAASVNEVQQEDPVPGLSGRWVNKNKGIELMIRPLQGGRLQVTLAGKGTGSGRFVKNMPGKFRFQIAGVGKGEFSVSNSDDSLIGWFVSEKSGRKVHARLRKVE